jgi:cytokinin dehydrogenase
MSNSPLPRRQVLQGGLVAAAVAAFNPVSRGWASEMQPHAVAVPSLDGQLLFDDATRTEAADDYGHIVHRKPWAVLVPGSINDIVKMVNFARANCLKIAAARGVGDDDESHSTLGQAQALGGIVINMSALNTIRSIDSTSAWVEAGVRWRQLLLATLPQGKSPPTLTDYLELSVGGTLSVGGIGGQEFRSGFQVDNVLELDVVTGKGELVRCSPSVNPTLFNVVRGGLGQYGIIVRARVKLVAVPDRARTYTAIYTSLPVFLADQKKLDDDGRFNYVEGSVVTAADGTRTFQLEVVKYYASGSPPNDTQLLSGLSYQPGSVQKTDTSYFDFVNRLAATVAFLKQAGLWGLPHPWVNMFVPDECAASFVQYVLDNTPAAEIGQDPVLLYAFKPGKLTAPLVKVPSGSYAFLFALLRTANPATAENVNRLLTKNRKFLERLWSLGGKAYPVSSGPSTQAEWQQHYGDTWSQVVSAKRAFDPDNVLTPGQNIFPY